MVPVKLDENFNEIEESDIASADGCLAAVLEVAARIRRISEEFLQSAKERGVTLWELREEHVELVDAVYELENLLIDVDEEE